jgi:aminoglycoside phosphotransferase (APT) family kinase protein
MTDFVSVRPAEQLDWNGLSAYLREQLPACGIPGLDLSRAIEVAQFPGGHSNLTYLVRCGDTELVLRRPPFGPVPPTAHDMGREYRWLAALHPVFPLAPKAYLFCDDPNVIGSMFYVMERRHGTVVRHQEPPEFADQPGMRWQTSEALVDTLAALHAIDVTGDLAALGKPSGFVARQVRGWTERWQRSKTAQLREMDALAEWLHARLPPDADPPTIVHGDYKLDNVMLDVSGARSRIVAVFDWEMCALGDPLVDLGILLAYSTPPRPVGSAGTPGGVPTSPEGAHDALTTVMDRPGWFTHDEIVERYAARSGRDLSGLRFYEIFALFKIAVVIQQIYFRFVRGQTDDPRFARFGDRVTSLARTAAALAERT